MLDEHQTLLDDFPVYLLSLLLSRSDFSTTNRAMVRSLVMILSAEISPLPRSSNFWSAHPPSTCLRYAHLRKRVRLARHNPAHMGTNSNQMTPSFWLRQRDDSRDVLNRSSLPGAANALELNAYNYRKGEDSMGGVQSW